MSADAEKPAFPEETEVYKTLNKWDGTFKEGPLTRNKNQIEVLIDKKDLLSFAKFLVDNGWPYVTSLSGADYPDREGEQLELVYHWASFDNPKLVVVKTRTSYEDPVVPALTPITQSTNFHEREVCELFGIRFPGHDKADETGYLPRLLLPDDWPQYEDDPPYPFRKEYEQIMRPYDSVTDTRGNQGKLWQKYHRPIDRSGWLDEYYKEETPIASTNTIRPHIPDQSKEESIDDKSAE